MKDANSLVAGDAFEETVGWPPNLKGVLVVEVCVCVVDTLEAGAPMENVKGELDGAAVDPNPLKVVAGPDAFYTVSSVL